MTRQPPAWARKMPIQPSSWRLIGLAAAVWLALSLSTPMFNSVLNYQSMAFQVAEVGLFALVIALSMLTSGIDLSIVSVANLSAIVTAKVFVVIGATNGGVGALVLGVAVGLLVGAVCGLVNGLIITRLNVSPILATLGTMQLFNGIAVGWTNGEAVYGMPPAFLALGSGTVSGIPTPFLVFAVVAGIVAVLIARSGLGFRIRMIGANAVASRFAGVPTRAVLVKAYLLCGLIAAVAGMVVSARTASANADYGQSYVLLAIVIAVLGGTDPNGGRTSIPGVALAALVLQMVASGFNLLGLSQFTYQIAQGAILIAVMGVATLTGRLDWRRFLARPLPTVPAGSIESWDGPDAPGSPTTPIEERHTA
ncbi:Autoinducer 2 import system permease protein LsrD [Propionicimonas sp. T2.31MG-18]|uniref:ABC transporter permease n=1 Tax=Propionicimonas sp. T2.31MG-18 TaxID=3157620 RepID=UPI0035EAF36B